MSEPNDSAGVERPDNVVPIRALANGGKQSLIRALAGLAISRLRLDNVAGITFKGARDLYDALGYVREIRNEDYRSRFERNGLAARIMEVKPQATWRGGGELIEDDDPQVLTDFEKAFSVMNDRLKIWSTLERADVISGLGRYGIILIGAPGEFEEPVTELQPNEVLYLSVFSEEDAPIAKFVNDQYSPRFGQAEYYSLKRLTSRTPITPIPDAIPIITPGGVAGDIGRRVHWTRVLHIAEGRLDDQVYGLPRLKRVWNLLDDLEKVTGGGAEAYWKRADQGMQFDLDKEMELPEDEKKKMKDEIEEYTHRLKRVLTTRGVSINPLGSDVASFLESCNAIIDQISAAVGIPQRILLGAEAGHLASTQDSESWAQRIRDRQHQFAEPDVIRPLVDRLIRWGALPTPKSYLVRWFELESLSDLQRAQIAVQLANVNKVMGTEVVTADEIRDRVLGFPPRKTLRAIGDGAKPPDTRETARPA